jgi:hypothetical protein
MADQVSAPCRPRLLSISSSRYDYQLDGRWPHPPEVLYLRLAPARLLAATGGLCRGTARKSSRR